MNYKVKQKGPIRKITGLDGLRAIAVLGVVGYHLFPHMVSGGFLGVNLFFVMSGYLIAVTSQRSQVESGFGIRIFYQKRIWRIYPALILTICTTAFCALFLAPDVLCGVWGEVFSIVNGSNNWWQIAQNASYFTRITVTSPFTHLWSLAVEMQFYLVWPVLFLLYMMAKRIGRNGAVFLLLLALISVLELALFFQPGEDPSRIYYGTDTRISALLLGSVLGLSKKKIERQMRYGKQKKLLLFFMMLTGMILLYFLADGQSAFTYRIVLPLSAFMSAVLIVLCADRRLPIGRWLDCPPFVWLGKRCYEIYLVQYPVIFFIHRSEPTDSILWNTLLAIALILLISQWFHQVSILLQSKERRFEFEKTKHEKTKLQDTRADLPAAGRNRNRGRGVCLIECSRAANGQRSATTPARASEECRPSGRAKIHHRPPTDRTGII